MSLLSWLGFDTPEERARKEEQRELARQEREQAVKDAQKQEQENMPIYQVGNTEDGRVTLRVDQFGTWISMTDEGVDQLIGMLQAAKGVPAEVKDDEE